ncbi:MAG: M6 family metalloprotease domain-containing protein [Candidatus Aminicenantes bacterium]|nr:M6 family metalloprotease domain-containing protein [Candidatus Aminicenantes bacterium]
MSFQFYGKEFTFTQPDGTTFKVRGWGDQHYAVFETLDGFSIVRDPNTGFYQFATLSEDGDDLVPSGARVDVFNAANLNLSPNIRINRASAKARGIDTFRFIGGKRRYEQRREHYKNKARVASMSASPLSAPPRMETKGEFLGLCLLIEFSDEPGTIPQTEVEDFCNKKGYVGFGNNGSVYDYFYENSGGLFEYKNVITAYYKARYPKMYYTNPAIPYGTRARQLIKEALDSLKSQGFDFNQLTTDYGGYVYALNIFYAGFCPNNWDEGLWPHAWSLATEYDISAGKVIFDYQFTDMGSELALATFCHENGHMMCDYPDLYDYGHESSGIGDYCLMCSGGRDEKNPTQICAYLKNASGWSTIIAQITHGAKISLTAGKNQLAIYSRNLNEYFIIENRNNVGRDASLPDSGLAIWHIDELGDNNHEQMFPNKHYEVSLEQADNEFDLERRKNHGGDSGDLFHAGYKDKFSDTTKPNSKWWDGSSSGLDIHNISKAGETIEFDSVVL